MLYLLKNKIIINYNIKKTIFKNYSDILIFELKLVFDNLSI